MSELLTTPLLSILIPTVVGREDELARLLDTQALKNIKWESGFSGITHDVTGMKNDDIEVVIFKDDKQISIGEKREILYKTGRGLYSIQIDDDDDISENAIELILEAIKSNPEIPCITFRERCMMNGEYKTSNHSIKYPQWMDNSDGYNFVRCPFYKDVIRTDIARSVPFEHIRYNEDERFSMAIKPLLTDEIHIDQEIYHYIYNETNHEERYGLNKK